MIYLICVVKWQFDHVFSFKDEHKSAQDFKIYHVVYRDWNAVSVGYAQLLFNGHENYNTTYNTCGCTIENYTKSNNITKLLTELS